MELLKKLESIGSYPHHGMLVNLPSLKTELSAGIGEFSDLPKLFDWLNSFGFDTIQLLPINDTGQDPSPYNPISFFALNPAYISLHKLPLIKEHPLLNEQLMILQDLNDLAFVTYPLIYQLKEKFLQFYAQTFYAEFKNHPRFIHFLEKNSWLKEYAAFKIIHNSELLLKSGKDPLTPSLNNIGNLLDQFSERYLEICLIQFLAYEQMSDVKNQASERDILICGDLPFLISKESTEAYFHPDWFNFNVSVGAPPDEYNPSGQNWGFPAYRWDNVYADNLAPLLDKLLHMESFYHMYRVDHVIGLYRQWIIQSGLEASNGTYSPLSEEKAMHLGHQTLQKIITTSNMVPIVEDLGVVPPFIRKSLSDLNAICTKVMRWEKDYENQNQFIHPKNYPQQSITCISTHDSTLIDQWWEENPDDAAKLCEFIHSKYQKLLSPSLRLELLKLAHNSSSIFHINPIQEYLSLNPIWKPKDPVTGRINTPGTQLAQNWTTRLIPTVEEIINDSLLIELISSIT